MSLVARGHIVGHNASFFCERGVTVRVIVIVTLKEESISMVRVNVLVAIMGQKLRYCPSQSHGHSLSHSHSRIKSQSHVFARAKAIGTSLLSWA